LIAHQTAKSFPNPAECPDPPRSFQGPQGRPAGRSVSQFLGVALPSGSHLESESGLAEHMMSNKEEKQERHIDLPPAINKPNIKRCYRCNGHFGLVRYRFAVKAFCSKRCLNEHKTDTERRTSRIKTWAAFLQKL
jgi:hypothetical protein